MNSTELHKNAHLLDLDSAMNRLGDESLLSELLCMLHESLTTDWHDFEEALAKDDIPTAVVLIHKMKGVVPIFSDKETARQIEELHKELRTRSNSSDQEALISSLKYRMDNFILQLNQWHIDFKK